MGMPRVYTCCKCNSLKKGCYIIGYLLLLIAIVQLVQSVVAAGEIFSGSNVKAAKYASLGLNMIGNAIMAVFSILLLIGVLKEKTVLVKVFLIGAIICTVIEFIIFGLEVYLCAIGDEKTSLSTSITKVLWTGFMIYFIIVVYSYYLDLKEEQLEDDDY